MNNITPITKNQMPAIITEVPGITPTNRPAPKIENCFKGMGTYKHRLIFA